MPAWMWFVLGAQTGLLLHELAQLLEERFWRRR